MTTGIGRGTTRRAATGLVVVALLLPLGACRGGPPDPAGSTGPDPLGGVEETLDAIERDIVTDDHG
jgi:hypothetical protein